LIVYVTVADAQRWRGLQKQQRVWQQWQW
jgi:hypothetical protein